MIVLVVGFACMAFGLYAGKKRAIGETWKMIVEGLCDKAVSPFRREQEESSAHDVKA